MAKSYESLMGAVGRSVFYRPERQRVRELLSRDARPRLLVDGDEYPLFDLSMNGVSFLSPNGENCWKVGDDLDLALVLHGDEVYRGVARIARAERGPRGSRIGVGLCTGFLDLPDILRRDDENRLERDLLGGPAELSDRVPKSYRRVMSDVVYYLQFYRNCLGDHESRYKSGLGGVKGCDELAKRAYESIRDSWWSLQVRAARAAHECLVDREILLAAKEYTEALVTPLAMGAPFVNRSYMKPLGYPGDYKVMEWCYANNYEGEDVFGRVLHKFFVDHYPLSIGVRTRKDLMVEIISREHQRKLAEMGDDARFRVVSLGCGPAKEVSEYISRTKNWPGKSEWTLIDQEEEALSVAYQASRRQIGKWQSNADLSLLNLSFVQMLSEGLPLQEPGTKDLIFSVGLFDYLRESRAQVLIRAMFDLLDEGGLIVIGNAVAPNEFFWAAEFLGDWTLLYRTKEEMRALANLVPESAEISVTTEPAGAYHFLLVRRMGTK